MNPWNIEKKLEMTFLWVYFCKIESNLIQSTNFFFKIKTITKIKKILLQNQWSMAKMLRKFSKSLLPNQFWLVQIYSNFLEKRENYHRIPSWVTAKQIMDNSVYKTNPQDKRFCGILERIPIRGLFLSLITLPSIDKKVKGIT